MGRVAQAHGARLGPAEVDGGELTVPLAGERPKGLRRTIRTTVRLLGQHSQWGEIDVHKGAVHVRDLRPGSEDALRHHLEAIVAQANAALEENGDGDEPQGPDAEMTARFRAFADQASGEAQPA